MPRIPLSFPAYGRGATADTSLHALTGRQQGTSNMGKASASTGFFQRLLTRPVPAIETDAADYGTCFGLELSLAPAAEESAPSPAAGPAPSGWIHRLARRDRTGS